MHQSTKIKNVSFDIKVGKKMTWQNCSKVKPNSTEVSGNVGETEEMQVRKLKQQNKQKLLLF